MTQQWSSWSISEDSTSYDSVWEASKAFIYGRYLKGGNQDHAEYLQGGRRGQTDRETYTSIKILDLVLQEVSLFHTNMTNKRLLNQT